MRLLAAQRYVSTELDCAPRQHLMFCCNRTPPLVHVQLAGGDAATQLAHSCRYCLPLNNAAGTAAVAAWAAALGYLDT